MLRDSQIFAARVVARVLAGHTLPDSLTALGFASERPSTRRFLLELTYGTLRQWGYLTLLAQALSPKKIKQQEIKTLLAVALYQLLYMRQPEYAVVNQAVRAAQVLFPGGKAFTNAILRRFLREKDALVAQFANDDRARFSYPEWWIARVKAQYPEHWADILEAGNQQPPLTLRVNRRQTTREALLQLLAAANIAAEAVGDCGIRLDRYLDVTTLPLFAEGGFSVQDAAAQWAAPLLNPRDGERVLDCCAAPGGKTTHLLELAALDLTALDVDPQRLARISENVERLRLNTIANAKLSCKVADAGQVETWWDGKPFDRILLDAPCSASGVVRRHPDIKWLRRDSDAQGFAEQQLTLLTRIWPLLRPGGRLLYATCSIFNEENAAVVDSFCSRQDDAERLTIEFGNAIPHLNGQLLPSSGKTGHNQDGLFYALLSKKP